MLIVFLGVDGSGKTTIINKISEVENVSYFHFGFSKRYNKKETNFTPHSKKKYSKFKSIIKIFFLLINFNFYYLLNIKNIEKRTVIIDRYFYDLVIDPIRYRLNLDKKFIEKFISFIPRPNLIICCLASPPIIHHRKPELSISEIERQQILIEYLSNKFDNCLKLDTSKNAPEDLLPIILEKINK